MFEYGGRRHYGVCCAEKGIFRFNVTAHGAAGHASLPRTGDNALLKLAPGAGRARRPARVASSSPKRPAALLRGLGEDPDDPARRWRGSRPADPRLRTLRRADVRRHADADDGQRLEQDQRDPLARPDPDRLPRPARASARRRRAGGSRRCSATVADELRIEFTEQVVGNASTVDSELMRAIERWVADQRPGRHARCR